MHHKFIFLKYRCLHNTIRIEDISCPTIKGRVKGCKLFIYMGIFCFFIALPGFCFVFGPGVKDEASDGCGWKNSATIPAECFRKTSNTRCRFILVIISQLTIRTSDCKLYQYVHLKGKHHEEI